MVSNSSTIYIAVQVDDKGGVKVVRQLGSESEKTGKKGKKAFSGMGKSLGSMNRKLSVAHKKLIGLAASVVSLAALYMAVRKLSSAIMKWIGLAEEQEAVETRLGAVLRSTGNAAGYNLDQLEAMAAGMQKITTIGDEVTLSGMAILATFKQIRGDEFERASKAAADMSEVMQTDLKSSIVMIGKALNDPIANLSAMSRAGVQFTKVQKDTIKTLWEMGDAAGAQAIILNELESQFEGAAAAARERFGGSVKAAKNALGDMREELGYVVTKSQFFIETAHLAEEKFIEWGEAIKANREELMLLAKDGFLYFVDVVLLATKAVSILHKTFAAFMKLAIKSHEWGPKGLGQSGLKWLGVIDETNADKMHKFLDPLLNLTGMYDEMIPGLERLRKTLGDIEVRPADSEGFVIGGLTAEEQEQAVKSMINSALEVANADKQILQDRLGEYRSFYGELQTLIQQTADREKQHIRELNELYKQKANIRMSTEAMVQGLRESRMDPAARYESQKSGLNKQYMMAMRMSGQEQIQALEQYKQAMQGLAMQYSEGIKAKPGLYGDGRDRYLVSSKKVMEEAISGIRKAAAIQQRALQELESEKERQILADRMWGDELTKTARDVAGEIEMLESTIKDLSEQIDAIDKLIKIEGEDQVSHVVKQIQSALNNLHDKTVIINEKHRISYVVAGGEGSESAPVEGSYAAGTRWVPKTGPYWLHKGEAVQTPGEASRDLRSSTRFGDIYIHVPESAAPQRPEDWRMITRQHIIPELEKAGRA